MSWIRFELGGTTASGKTSFWYIRPKEVSSGPNGIGTIRWYGPWRKYCFHPEQNTVWEEDCLREVSAFCESRTKEHREKP